MIFLLILFVVKLEGHDLISWPTSEGHSMSDVLDVKSRLKWFGHVKRRDVEYVSRRDTEVGSLKARGPEEIHRCSERGHKVNVKEDQVRWRQMIGCGQPFRQQAKVLFVSMHF